MYSPNEPTPHVNTFSNTIFLCYVSLHIYVVDFICYVMDDALNDMRGRIML